MNDYDNDRLHADALAKHTAELTERNDNQARLMKRLAERWNATQAVLRVREKELLDLKGPCSNPRCRLHHAHSGPCDTTGPVSPGDAGRADSRRPDDA
jgi:hypothetical protein